jgi:hypothetical protein
MSWDAAAKGAEQNDAVAAARLTPEQAKQRLTAIDGELKALSDRRQGGKPLTQASTPVDWVGAKTTIGDQALVNRATALFRERDALAQKLGVAGTLVDQPARPPAVDGKDWVQVEDRGWGLMEGVGSDCKTIGAKRTIVTQNGAYGVMAGLPIPFPGYKWQIERKEGPASALGLHTYQATLMQRNSPAWSGGNAVVGSQRWDVGAYDFVEPRWGATGGR